MPPGCLRARTASANRPSSAVGACRYSSSASSPRRRSPARTLSDSPVMFGMVEIHRAFVRDQPELIRVHVESPEPLELLPAEKVPNIMSQVPAGRSLTLGTVRKVRTGDSVYVRDALVSSALERFGVGRLDGVRPTGPERVHEGQSGHRRPRFTEVDLLDCRLQKQRVVPDDQRCVTVHEHVVEIRAARLEARLNLEETSAED